MWWKFSSDILSANLEAQRVIGLHLAKLARGGPAANKEAHRMVMEKMAASTEAAATLAAGGSMQTVLSRYRTIMRANKKRLAAKAGRRK